MIIRKEAISGTLTSNDCFVRISPAEKGIDLTLESPVKKQFGKQMEAVIRETLSAQGIENATIIVEDRGALDCTIAARVETAVKRANE